MSKIIIQSNAKDIARLAKIVPARASKFKKASAAPLPVTYAVNETAKQLHPARQQLCIKEIIVHSNDAKSYVFEASGRAPLAYFRAGQYLSINLRIGDSVLTRPYSIASTPAQALEGKYVLTIKRVPGGFSSNYILDNWTVGTVVSASAPEGTFYYDSLRDAKTVVGVAGGGGMTALLSLAGSIADGTQDLNLVLLYGSRTKEEILFREELDKYEKCGKVKVIYVLSEEEAQGYEHGFITAQLIKKYAPEGQYSLFVCGSPAMYKFIGKEIELLDLPKKFVRFDLTPGSALPGEKKDYCCTVSTNKGETQKIACRSDESILTAIERAGIKAPSHCRCGECGFCRLKLVKGEVYVPDECDGRRAADISLGYIHPCCTYPVGDVWVRLP